MLVLGWVTAWSKHSNVLVFSCRFHWLGTVSYSKQIICTNMQASGAPKQSRAWGAQLASIFVSWISGNSWLMVFVTWSCNIRRSTLLAVISLFNWPVQIIQSSAGGFPSNHIKCLTSHQQLTKTCNQLCLANPTDKYNRQWSFSPPTRSFTGSHICQLDLLGTVDYTVFVSWWWDFFLRSTVLAAQS